MPTKYAIGEDKLSGRDYATTLYQRFEDGNISADEFASDFIETVQASGFEIYIDGKYSEAYHAIKKSLRDGLNKKLPNLSNPAPNYEEYIEPKGANKGNIVYRHSIFLRLADLERKIKETAEQEIKEIEKANQLEETVEDMFEMINPEIKAQAEQAMEHLDIDWKELLERSLTSYCKSINNRANFEQDDLSGVSTEELLTNRSYFSHPLRAKELVNRSIRAIKVWNEKNPDPLDQWAITQSAIQRLTGCDSNKCKEFLAFYQTDIDDYNTRFRNPNLQNRKRNGNKIQDLINIAELVPESIQ